MSIWQIVRNVHLIFVEKAEIVQNAIFPLYKKGKVWYTKQWWAKRWVLGAPFFVVEK